jgi:hypothetical protein
MFLISSFAFCQEKSILFNEITHHLESGNFRDNNIELFTEKKQIFKNKDKYLSLKIEKQKINTIIENSDKFISLSIPISETENKIVYLKKRQLLQDNFKLVIETSKGAIEKPMPKYVAYSGIVADENSIASITFVNNTMRGIVSIGSKEFTIAPKNDIDGEMEYIIYEKSEIEQPTNDFTCGTKDENFISNEIQNRTSSQSIIPKCVNVHFEIEGLLNINWGGIEQSISKFLVRFNIVQTIYSNDGITLRTSYLKIWNNDSFPYLEGNDLGLSSFSTMNPINGNIAFLLTDFHNTPGVAGIAYLGGNYGVAGYQSVDTPQGFPIYSSSANTIAHELGHNLGSNHTHWCGWPGGAIDNCAMTEGGCSSGPTPTNGGTIMSYCFNTNNGVNFNNGFGNLPKNAILNFINSSSNFTSCDEQITCLDNIVNATNVTNITNNTFTINWSSTYPVKIYVKNPNSSSFTLINTIQQPTNFYQFTYTPSQNCEYQTYEIKLIAVCPNGESKPTVFLFSPQGNSKPIVWETTQNFCNSATFSQISAGGTNIKYYATEIGGIEISPTTSLYSGTFYLSQTVNGCESKRVKVIVNISNVLPPTGASTQQFGCGATLQNLVVQGNGNIVRWWDAPTGGNELINNPVTSTLLVPNTYYYASNEVYGYYPPNGTTCQSQTRLQVLAVNPNYVYPPTINETIYVCYGTKLADVPVSGTNIKWYSNNNFGVTPYDANNIYLYGNSNMYVSQTINGCESIKKSVNIVVNPVVNAPTINNYQSFCSPPTISQIAVNGNNVNWYSSASGGQPLPNNLQIVQSLTLYASKLLNNCESNDRSAVYIEIGNVSTPITESTQTFYCNNPSVADLQVDNLQNTVWWDSPTGGNSYFGGEPIVNNQYYYAQNNSYSPNCSSNRIQVQAIKTTAAPPAYNIPFTETFNKSICALGYSTGSAANSGDIVDNVLKVPNFNTDVNDDFVITKKINLIAGTTYYISFKTKKLINNQNASIITDIYSTANYFSLGTYSTVTDSYSTVNYSVIPTVSGQFNLRFKVYAGNSDGVLIDDLSITTSLSTDENIHNLDNIKIYPNPTDNLLFIDTTEKQIQEIEIFDLQGRLLKTIKENKEKYQIDISNFSSATYLVKLSTEKGSQTVKIVKK